MDIKREIMTYFADLFETRQRPDNTEDFICLPDDKRDSVWSSIVMECHDHAGMLPDDWRYRFISQIADALAKEESEQWEDRLHEIVDGIVTIYNYQLLDWVSSHVYRADYVAGAVREGLNGSDFDLFRALMAGQYMEIEEIAQTLISEIETLAEDARPYVAARSFVGCLPDDYALCETEQDAYEWVINDIGEMEEHGLYKGTDAEEDIALRETDGEFSFVSGGYHWWVSLRDDWIQDIENGE